MAYQVELTEAARKQLRKLPQVDQATLAPKLRSLATDPRQAGAKRLQGTDSGWRVRAGDYRILYVIEDTRVLVTVFRVARRKEAYRNLPEPM